MSELHGIDTTTDDLAEVYGDFLRAGGHIDFEWFVQQGDDVREVLVQVGTKIRIEQISALAMAIRVGPDELLEALDADDPDVEEAQVARRLNSVLGGGGPIRV